MKLLLRGMGIAVLAIGLLYKSLIGAEIDPELNGNTTLSQIRSKVWQIDGYFIHYGEGAFDWIYIVRNTGDIYKLEGMEPISGYFIWTRLPYPEAGLEIVKSGDLIFIGQKIGDSNTT